MAAAAAKAGFDEIQFDYVRFPSDGDLTQIRYAGPRPQALRWTIPAFVQYAAQRLHPLGVRVSAALEPRGRLHDRRAGPLTVWRLCSYAFRRSLR